VEQQEEGLPIRPQPDGSDIHMLTDAELPTVIEAVARAFYDDPVFSWLFPGDDRRLEQLERGFDLFARRIWMPHDEAFTTDRLIGGAFWLPPDTWHLSLLQQLSLTPATIRFARSDGVRLLRILNLIESNHPHDRHYYLPVIGVLPEWQGRGFGAALLRPMLERCDRERMPAYLEASSLRNRALYERNGFEVTDELTVGGSPPLWPMWRKPR
jgi:ribosomal protein S18 acetylase RimI-like enzyme